MNKIAAERNSIEVAIILLKPVQMESNQPVSVTHFPSGVDCPGPPCSVVGFTRCSPVPQTGSAAYAVGENINIPVRGVKRRTNIGM